MDDFYPMPIFVNLEVSNIDISAEWYQQALGFREVYRGQGLSICAAIATKMCCYFHPNLEGWILLERVS